MPFVADGIWRVSDSECFRKLELFQCSFDNFGGAGEPTITFTDRVENYVDGVAGNQYAEQLPSPDRNSPEFVAMVAAIRAYWHSYSDTLGNV